MWLCTTMSFFFIFYSSYVLQCYLRQTCHVKMVNISIFQVGQGAQQKCRKAKNIKKYRKAKNMISEIADIVLSKYRLKKNQLYI